MVVGVRNFCFWLQLLLVTAKGCGIMSLLMCYMFKLQQRKKTPHKVRQGRKSRLQFTQANRNKTITDWKKLLNPMSMLF